MKRLWILALAFCWSSVTAHGLGIVLTAFKMFTAEKTEVFYAKVQAQGRDFEEAKSRAFRLAVEQAVGSVILSETEIRNQRIVRDEIVSYSSGFVERYTVLSRHDSPSMVDIIVEVWVAHSAIANRLLAKNATEQGINGEQLATQFGSIIDERQRGDRLLQTVLNDHPKRSMQVKMKTPRIKMDAHRNVVVDLDWELHWADQYTDSLQQTAKQFRSACGVWSKNCPVRYGLLGYEVEDPHKVIMVWHKLAHTELAIQFVVFDQHERVVTVKCRAVDIEGVLVQMYNDSVVIPNKYVRGSEKFNFGNNTNYIGTLNRFHAQVVERKQCQG